MSAAGKARMRCVVCGDTDDVHLHHVAGVAHLPDVIVAVCRTRHVAWHRALRDAGVVLRALGSPGDCLRERLIATAFGFRVILEEGAVLSDDPGATRAAIRRRAEAGLTVIDAAALGEDGTSPSAPLRTRRPASVPLAGEGERDCRPRRPMSHHERCLRMEAFLAGLLVALGGLLDASLPPELAALELSDRLRRIDAAQLAAGAALQRGPSENALAERVVKGVTGASEGLEIANLGRALEVCVGALEAIATVGRADG